MRGRERGCARRTNDAGREDSVVMKSSARETTSLLDGDMRGAGGDEDETAWTRVMRRFWCGGRDDARALRSQEVPRYRVYDAANDVAVEKGVEGCATQRRRVVTCRAAAALSVILVACAVVLARTASGKRRGRFRERLHAR